MFHILRKKFANELFKHFSRKILAGLYLSTSTSTVFLFVNSLLVTSSCFLTVAQEICSAEIGKLLYVRSFCGNNWQDLSIKFPIDNYLPSKKICFHIWNLIFATKTWNTKITIKAEKKLTFLYSLSTSSRITNWSSSVNVSLDSCLLVKEKNG